MKKLLKNWKTAFAGVSTTVATSWLADLTLRKFYQEPELDHELHEVSSRDGTELALWRYLPKAESPGEPILLVHGLAANHRTFTYHNHSGLIPLLCEQGYDCWAVDLRGRGKSEEPDEHWGFDDYAKKDLPAVIDTVLEQVDFPRMHWVGFSMGGMLYYALAGSLDYGDKLATGTTIGSPVKFHDPTLVDYFGDQLHSFPFKLKKFPLSYLLRWLGFTLGMVPEFMDLPLVNLNNVDDKILRRFPSVVFANTSTRAITQYPNWSVNDTWTDEDGTVNYRKGVENVRVPSLVIAGAGDELCPTRGRAGYDKINTDDKKFVLASEDNGFHHDYSHLDLIFGKHANDEIYSEVVDWIERHPIEKSTSRKSRRDTRAILGSFL
ncbi:MAG: alpha/beta fold hydrolase [bacterium]